jgi:hypothetical protein
MDDVTEVNTEPVANGLTFNGGDSTEMLRIASDGFYVRGKKLKQDDKEAEAVYNSFTQWLAWAQLNQQ